MWTIRTLWVLVLITGLSIGTLSHAADFMVENLDDSGLGSLRQAITESNDSSGANTIAFESGLEGTITLASPLPVIVEDLELIGPGADRITVSGDSAFRVLHVGMDVEVTISGLTFANGLADAAAFGIGGGILNEGDLILDDCVVTNNEAEFSGGGIGNDGILSLVRSTISNNAANPDEYGVGGGLENVGRATIIASTISGNTADSGGGLAINDGELLLANSTVSGNSAEFLGGGIDNFNGIVKLLHVTVTDNSGMDGGGLSNEAEATIKNSLIVENSGGDCDNELGDSFQSEGDNLDTDDTCPGFSTNSSASLALGQLADNGGLTLTHALGGDSVAVNAATDCTEIDGTTGVIEDQRGVSRPQGEDCDIGAFELVGNDDVIFFDRFKSD